MIELLGKFIAELRRSGVPVSISEHVDAAKATEVIELTDRSLLRSSLQATLVKDHQHESAFLRTFDLFFDAGNAEFELREGGERRSERNSAEATTDHGDPGVKGAPTMSHSDLTEVLADALRNHDDSALATAAAEAVARYAGIDQSRPLGDKYYLERTMRKIDQERLEEKLRATRSESPTRWQEQAYEQELKAMIRHLRHYLERSIRRQLVANRGVEEMAKVLRKPLPEDVDVMHATTEELAQLEKTLQPLSRKLAVRLARKRRRRHRGAIDMRHTVRSSLSTGGVPIDVRFKPPRPVKPEIMVIADISGSVSSFARFTLLLVHAISSQFSKVRSFVFVDGLDEVTRFFDGHADPKTAVERINHEADVIAGDGHSDYGRALLTFFDRHIEEVTRRSTVLILGDARNNYHQSQHEIVREIAARAKSVYWLNPEPKAYWNSGDSILAAYEPYCTGVVEVRTIRQLEHFVGSLA